MILVDSSVWIDFFNGMETPQTITLKKRLGTEQILLGDLILTEVLQGFRHDKDYKKALQLFYVFPVVALAGEIIAIKAANNYRILRKKGITVRGAIDIIIATYCLEHKVPLLYSDRDFDVVAKHLGVSCL